MSDVKVSRSWAAQLVDSAKAAYDKAAVTGRQATRWAELELYAFADRPWHERLVVGAAEGATLVMAWPVTAVVVAAQVGWDVASDQMLDAARTKLPPGVIEDLEQFVKDGKLQKVYLQMLGDWYVNGGVPPVPLSVPADQIKPEHLIDVTSTVKVVPGKVGTTSNPLTRTVKADALGSAMVVLLVEKMIADGTANPKGDPNWYLGYKRLKADVQAGVGPAVWTAAKQVLDGKAMPALTAEQQAKAEILEYGPPKPPMTWDNGPGDETFWWIPCNRKFGGTCKASVPRPSWWAPKYDAIYTPTSYWDVERWYNRLTEQTGYLPGVSWDKDGHQRTIPPTKSFADKKLRPAQYAERPDVDVPNEDVRWWWDWYGERPIVRAALALRGLTAMPNSGIPADMLIDIKNPPGRNVRYLMAGGAAALTAGLLGWLWLRRKR